MQDWKKRYHRSGVTLDLILDGGKCDPRVSFDESLQDAVRSHVVRHTIREVHLRSDDGVTLSSIISLLAPDDEDAWNENIESIIWRNNGTNPVEFSQIYWFRFSKLHLLDLSGNFRTSVWDRLTSRTTLLTSLLLKVSLPRANPTTSQLLSILISNPNFQQLSLPDPAPPQMTPIGPHFKCRRAT